MPELNSGQQKAKDAILPMQAVCYSKIQYGQFEQWIKRVWGVELEIPCNMECSNGANLELNASIRKGDIPNYHIEDMEKIRAALYDGADFPNYCMHQLFDFLAEKGFIAEGRYLIDVSW